MTRGEQGLVVSMNTRWLPHYVRLRQALGLEPIRYNFGPTSHEPLAQSRRPLHVPLRRPAAARGKRWATEETGARRSCCRRARRSRPVPVAIDAGLFRSGIESEKPLTLAIQPILYKTALPPGRYTLSLSMLDPTSTAAGQRVFEVSVSSDGQRRTEASHPRSGRFRRGEGSR